MLGGKTSQLTTLHYTIRIWEQENKRIRGDKMVAQAKYELYKLYKRTGNSTRVAYESASKIYQIYDPRLHFPSVLARIVTAYIVSTALWPHLKYMSLNASVWIEPQNGGKAIHMSYSRAARIVRKHDWRFLPTIPLKNIIQLSFWQSIKYLVMGKKLSIVK